MNKRNLAAMLGAGVILAALILCLAAPGSDWLSVDALKRSRALLADVIAIQPIPCGAGFFLLCTLATAACFPAAPLLGMAGGALFGFWPGMLLVLGASSIGSIIAFLDSRYLLRGWVKRRFGQRIAAIDRGMERHGGLYLLTLRLNPVVPYWLVNLAMGLTAIGLKSYALLTAAGLAPATVLYVNAGTQLARIETPADVLTPGVLLSLTALSLLPLVFRVLSARVGARD